MDASKCLQLALGAGLRADLWIADDFWRASLGRSSSQAQRGAATRFLKPSGISGYDNLPLVEWTAMTPGRAVGPATPAIAPGPGMEKRVQAVLDICRRRIEKFESTKPNVRTMP